MNEREWKACGQLRQRWLIVNLECWKLVLDRPIRRPRTWRNLLRVYVCKGCRGGTGEPRWWNKISSRKNEPSLVGSLRPAKSHPLSLRRRDNSTRSLSLGPDQIDPNSVSTGWGNRILIINRILTIAKTLIVNLRYMTYQVNIMYKTNNFVCFQKNPLERDRV